MNVTKARRCGHGPVHRAAGAWFALLTGFGLAAHAEDITLISGEVLEAEIIGQTAGHITVDHQLLGEMHIPLETIALIDDEPLGDWLGHMRAAEASESVDAVLASNEHTPPLVEPPHLAGDGDGEGSTEAEEQDVREEVKTMEVIADVPDDEPPKRPRPQWDYKLEFGLIGTHGNSEDLNLRTGVRAERKSESNRLAFDANYRFGTSRGDTSENKWSAGGIIEWPFKGTKWTGFLQGRVESDEFASWDHRITGGAGVQYRLYERKKLGTEKASFGELDLTLRGGFGFRQEFGSQKDGFAPEGLLGASSRWYITERMRVNAESTFYPDFRDGGEFRVVSKADWTIDIDQMDGVSFKIGVEHEYDSQVNPGLAHNDVRGYATLVVNF